MIPDEFIYSKNNLSFSCDLIKKQMQVRGDYNVIKHTNWWECTKYMEKSRISWIL